MDMSCGSGLFSRRFVRSGKFSGVIAADFSESMLTQAKQFFEEDRGVDTRSVHSQTGAGYRSQITYDLWEASEE